MLVDCPKCGFSQPEDQYCAQCGIDMHSYVAPRASLGKRILKHPLFPLLLLLPMAYGYFLYDQEQKAKTLRQRMEYLTGASASSTPTRSGARQNQAARVESEQAPAASTTGAAQDQLGSTDESARSADRFDFNRGASLNGTNAADEAPTAEQAEAEDAEAKAEVPTYVTPTLSVIYAEVSNDFLARLSGQDDGASFRDYGVYAEQQVQRLQEQISYGLQSGDVKILERTSRNFQNLNSSLQWFSGVRNNNSQPDLGMTTMMALNGQESGELFVDLELLVSLPQSAESSRILPQPYMSSFALNPNRGFLITGMIPHQRPPDNRREAYNQGILKVTLSEDFTQNLSQFAVFIFIDTAQKR